MWYKLAKKVIFRGVAIVIFVISSFGHVQAEENVEVHVLGLYDLTGPYAQQMQLVVRGVKDAVRFVNDTEYIPGVKIVHDIYDHGSDVSKAVFAFQNALGKKPRPVIGNAGHSTPIALAIKPLAERYQIPCIEGSAARAVHNPPGWIFSYFAEYEGCLGAVAAWLKMNWKQDSEVEWIRKHYQNRLPRISVLGWDNAFGRSFDQPEVRAYMKKIGVEFVQPEYIPMAPTDTSAQLLRFKEAGVDLIYNGTFASAQAVVLKDAERLGIRNDFMWSVFWGSQLLNLVNLVGPLAENVTVLTGTDLLIEEWPQYFRESFQKSGLKPANVDAYANAVGWLDICCEAIRRATKAVGSPEKLDGKAVYQALLTFKDFKPMCYTCRYSFSKTKTIGADTGDIYQVEKGKIVRIAKDWRVPDLRPGGKDVPK